MSTNFKPLRLNMIEEGQLESDFNLEFSKMQGALCEYLTEWKDKAKGATASVQLKLTIKCESADDGFFSVKADITSKLPARPSRTTLAMQGEEDGEPCLFSRASGTIEDDPRQARLCTIQGEAIDPETGEVTTDKAEIG